MTECIGRGAPLGPVLDSPTAHPHRPALGRVVAMKAAQNYHDGTNGSEGAVMEHGAGAVVPAVIHIYPALGIDWSTHHVHLAGEFEDGSLDLDRLYCCGSPEAVSLAVRQVAGRHWQCPGVYAGCERPSNGRPVRIRIKGSRYVVADAVRARR